MPHSADHHHSGIRPAFLESLAQPEVDELLDALERRTYAAGSYVVAEGDRLVEMFLVESGSGEVWVRDRQGTQRLVATVGPGAPIGEMALLTNAPASATVRASTDMVVAVLGVADFLELTQRHPQILRSLGALLAQRLAGFYKHELQVDHGRVVALRDLGAPPSLGYALACSIAWHTRQSVVYVSDAGVEHPLDPDTPVACRVAISAERLASPAELRRLVDELAHTHGTVLVAVGPEMPTEFAGRAVDLAGPGYASPNRLDQPAIRLQALRPTTLPRARLGPDAAGCVDVPPFTPADETALGRGLLPSNTPAGRALGWAARDLCGLKVGLVLGSGSVKGYAHYGVLRALERVGLQADCVAGTSIGSIVATTYALGWTADRALVDMEQTSWRAFRPTLPLQSILSNGGVHFNFRKAAGDRRIEDLDIPLAIVTADLTTGQEVVFRRGLLRTAALASMAIPGVYPPLRFGERLLVDGGILNPVPISAVVDMGADVVIAVSLSSGARQPMLNGPAPEAGEPGGPLPSILQTVLRSVEVMQSRIGSASTGAASILIEPDFRDVPPVSITTFHKGRPYVGPGERAAEAALPRIAAALPWIRSAL